MIEKIATDVNVTVRLLTDELKIGKDTIHSSMPLNTNNQQVGFCCSIIIHLCFTSILLYVRFWLTKVCVIDLPYSPNLFPCLSFVFKLKIQLKETHKRDMFLKTLIVP